MKKINFSERNFANTCKIKIINNLFSQMSLYFLAIKILCKYGTHTTMKKPFLKKKTYGSKNQYKYGQV